MKTERDGLTITVSRPLDWHFGPGPEAEQRPAEYLLLYAEDKRGHPYYSENELTPTEARQLAADLLRLADECEGKEQGR